MKNILILFAFVLASTTSIYSQIEFGLKAGIHSFDLVDASAKLVTPGGEDLQLSILESDYGFHFGLYSRLKFLGIFIEPGALFNSSTVNYKLDGSTEGGFVSNLLSENFYNLDIPVMLGFKLFFLNVYGGPVAHFRIDGTSDLIDFPGYSERFNSATYGYRAGLGLDLWSIRLQAAYEGNLSAFGEHMYIGDSLLAFDKNPGRILFTLGLKF